MLDRAGKLVAAQVRTPTPKPATPQAVLGNDRRAGGAAAVVRSASPSAFPAWCKSGKVVTAPNLGTEHWAGFELMRTLSQRFGVPARVLNDAAVQGLGVVRGPRARMRADARHRGRLRALPQPPPAAAARARPASCAQGQDLRPVHRPGGAGRQGARGAGTGALREGDRHRHRRSPPATCSISAAATRARSPSSCPRTSRIVSNTAGHHRRHPPVGARARRAVPRAPLPARPGRRRRRARGNHEGAHRRRRDDRHHRHHRQRSHRAHEHDATPTTRSCCWRRAARPRRWRSPPTSAAAPSTRRWRWRGSASTSPRWSSSARMRAPRPCLPACSRRACRRAGPCATAARRRAPPCWSSSHDRNAAIFTFRGANTLLEEADLRKEAFAADLVYVSSLSNESADAFPAIVAGAKAQGALVATNPGVRQLSSRGRRLPGQRWRRSTSWPSTARRPTCWCRGSSRVSANAARSAARRARRAAAAACRARLRRRRPRDEPCRLLRGAAATGAPLRRRHRRAPRRLPRHRRRRSCIAPCSRPRSPGTAGAGDAFNATFTACIALGRPAEEALRAAAVNAASVVGHVDTQTGLLALEEIDKRLAASQARAQGAHMVAIPASRQKSTTSFAMTRCDAGHRNRGGTAGGAGGARGKAGDGERAHAVLARAGSCALVHRHRRNAARRRPDARLRSCVPAGLVPLLDGVRRGLGGAMAVLTGRRIADVDRLFAPLRFVASGVHGTELRAEPGAPITTLARRDPLQHCRRRCPSIGGWRPASSSSRRAAASPCTTATRRSRSGRWSRSVAAILAASSYDLVLRKGRKVLEAVPRGYSKGTALAADRRRRARSRAAGPS